MNTVVHLHSSYYDHKHRLYQISQICTKKAFYFSFLVCPFGLTTVHQISVYHTHVRNLYITMKKNHKNSKLWLYMLICSEMVCYLPENDENRRSSHGNLGKCC